MNAETKYFLIPASSGLCIQPGRNKTETAPVRGDGNQLWHIEQGERNKIAFRNANSGIYLRAAGGYKSNAVQAGARQWWTLETSDTPHAFWIKCDDYPNAYLCNSYGNITPNNTIYMWAREANWTQTMLWYFFDYDSWSKHRTSKPDLSFSSLTSESQQNNAELEEKLKEAEDKQHELEQQLKIAEDKQRELESEAKDGADRDQQLDDKEKELAEREKELESRSEAASAKEKDINTREQTLADKEAGTSKGGEEGDGASREEFQKLNKQLTGIKSELGRAQEENRRLQAKEAELAKLQQEYKELKDSKANGSSQAGTTSVAGRSQSDSKKTEASRVGFRDEPLGLRTRDSRPATTKGRLAPIQLQQGFSHLPRLRA